MDQVDDSLNMMTSGLQRRTAVEDEGNGDASADVMNPHSSSVIAVAAGLPSFQYFISEQAKSMLALQELQNEVGALLEFRDLVMDAFPHLSQKLETTYGNVIQSQTALSPTKWVAGTCVKRKLPLGREPLRGDSEMLVSSLLPRYRSNSQGKASRSSEVSGGSAISSAIQDSGFCTESNKDHSSAISSRSKSRETEDELFSLLDHIHSKGTRLKLEVEYLWGKVDHKRNSSLAGTNKRRCKSLDDLILTDHAAHGFTFECAMRTAFLEAELNGLKKERDLLLKKIAHLESENRANLAQMDQLLAEVETISSEKKDLEERLREADIGSGDNDLHTNFLGRGHWRNAQTPLAKNQLLNLMQVFKDSNQGTCTSGADGSAAHFLSSKNAATVSPTSASKDCYYTPEHSQSSRIDRPTNPVTKELNVYSYNFENADKDASVTTLASTKDFNEPATTIGDRVNRGAMINEPDMLTGFQSGRLPFVEPSKHGGVTLSKEKVLSILNEYDPATLHRFLLTLCYQIEALNAHVQRVTKSRALIFQQVDECKKENDKLKLELKLKDIELEGTKAENRELERMRNEKLCYSASDLATTVTSSRPRIGPVLSDTVSLAEKTVEGALSNHCNRDSRDVCDRMRNGGNSMRPNVSRIPLKTPPTKVNPSGKTKTSASFKDYSAFQSSCISYTSSSLSNK